MEETKPEIDSKIHRIVAAAERFTESVGRVIVGKKEAIQSVFIGLLCGGHLLIEDVPGVGKTLLAKAAARSLGCSFKRIQCTPDLLPADVTGLHYFNQKTSEFEFRPGRYWPILSWSTKSTGPCRAPNPVCWKACRSARSPWTGTPFPCRTHS